MLLSRNLIKKSIYHSNKLNVRKEIVSEKIARARWAVTGRRSPAYHRNAQKRHNPDRDLDNYRISALALTFGHAARFVKYLKI